ncbi:X-linked retinitis pigmentosa GTPase regulator isoform X3 [Gossypium hirsutum]|uniref:X-linked retinitis pigmentosa GTPase regulator isoform X3 n=1 Tax=Gossypium hirsutum TaxID=3635 RepID=A0ABM3BT70_GOSHI|nr:X-linked retinitis pigmentosa GTPase regulator-like isoform X3 [Gossypium hirsutum]
MIQALTHVIGNDNNNNPLLVQLHHHNQYQYQSQHQPQDDGTYAMKKVLIQNNEQLELVREEIRVSSSFSHQAAKAVHKPTNVECLSGLTIKLAALGSEHTVVVTDGGEALSWGAVASGRLGHGLESSIFGFLTSDRSKELQLACCIQHALMILICLGIAETRSLFVFGDKVVANLGFGEAKNATMPSMINTLPYSEEVACGGYNTCVVTSNSLYCWNKS